MQKFKHGDSTFILAEDIPFNINTIGDLVRAKRIRMADIFKWAYDINRLSYAAIVLFIRVLNVAIQDFSKNKSPIVDKLASLLEVMPLKNTPKPSNTRNATSLLKAIYFLILATKNGSDIAEHLLNSDVIDDKESEETYQEYKATLDTMFDEYTGFGEPVCAEIVDIITTLIDFVKQQSGENIEE